MPKCAECSATFKRTQHKQVFCGPKCKQAYHNRAAARGKTLVPLALAWRGSRSTATGKRAFTELCAVVSRFNEEDKAAGRMPAAKFLGRQYALFLKP